MSAWWEQCQSIERDIHMFESLKEDFEKMLRNKPLSDSERSEYQNEIIMLDARIIGHQERAKRIESEWRASLH